MSLATIAKSALLLLALSTTGAACAAGIIDFETVPAGISADQIAISNQYQSLFGVTFSLSTGATPYLEEVGQADPGNGFLNNVLGVNDTAAVGYAAQLKNYFLRIGTGNLQVGTMPQLIITYTAPVSAASAQIWDIDGNNTGTEQWLVEAYGGGGSVIDSVTSPLGVAQDATSLDGKPWNWSFNHGGTTDIFEIRLTFVGSKTAGIGLAFDNFSPSSVAEVPEPDVWVLMLCGLAVMRLCRRTPFSAQA